MNIKGMVKCEYQEIKDLVELVEHPRNTRKHSKEQIEYIARLYKYTGIRHPIIISERSRFIVAGHARKKAAELLGLKEFPVDIQEFESEAEEYAFLEADNNIAELAEHDKLAMIENVRELENDLKLDMLGVIDIESYFPQDAPGVELEEADGRSEYEGMPEYDDQDEERAIERTLLVHLGDKDAEKQFFEILDIPYTKAKSVRYPPIQSKYKKDLECE